MNNKEQKVETSTEPAIVGNTVLSAGWIPVEKQLPQTIVSSGIFGDLDKYFEDLKNYEDELYCSICGNDSKKTFNYIRTVANGEVYWCKRCKTENLVSEKPDEDNY